MIKTLMVLSRDVTNPSPDGRKKDVLSLKVIPAGTKFYLKEWTESFGDEKRFSTSELEYVSANGIKHWSDEYASTGRNSKLYEALMTALVPSEPTHLEWLDMHGIWKEDVLVLALTKGMLTRDQIRELQEEAEGAS